MVRLPSLSSKCKSGVYVYVRIAMYKVMPAPEFYDLPSWNFPRCVNSHLANINDNTNVLTHNNLK